ncbi:DUF4328 domain-containing protein [Streptomyces lydicus]|uniref:DUF4328 domain-containing protein n=1 Tax=Streptomyces lydicus TaxID=47763 RepID=UPI00379206C3
MPTNAQPVGELPRTVTGAATTATVLIAVALVHAVLVLVANWRLYFLAHDYLAGAATAADLEAADNDALATVGAFWPSMLVWITAGIGVVVWLWRARINSELMSGAAAHRRARGWVVGAWTTPVANLWIPYQVVSDVWRASAPRRTVPVGLINAWWALFVVANFVVKPIQWRMSATFASEQDVLSNANVTTLLTVLYMAAGLLLVVIVRRVTAWQTHGQTQTAA